MARKRTRKSNRKKLIETAVKMGERRLEEAQLHRELVKIDSPSVKIFEAVKERHSALSSIGASEEMEASDFFVAMVAQFDAAARADEMKGARDPEERNTIEREYLFSRALLLSFRELL